MDASLPFKYKAFLSYSHADASIAVWLHKRLERFPLRSLFERETELGTIPGELRPIFRDREDFSAGASLNEQTVAALGASAALIVLCSPASARSAAVNEEIRLFKHRHRDRRIIPLIVGGKPYDADQECFAPALRFKLDNEGRITNEPVQAPLAADIRKGADGRELALAKLVAALIGVPSDDVYRRAEREKRRQQRVRYAIIAVMFMLACGGGYLGWRAYTQQEILSDIETLLNKYAPIGSAEAAQPGARERLRNAFEAIVKGTPTDPRYKQALDLIKAGKPQEAEPLLRESAQEEEAAGLNRIRQAAEKYRNLGAIAGLADPKSARDYYARAARLDPDNMTGMYWHAYMEALAGKLIEAERAYNLVRAMTANTVAEGEMQWAAQLGLGEIQVVRGNLDEALKIYQKAAADAERRAIAEWKDAAAQRNLSMSLDRVGDVLLMQGKKEEALKVYENSLSVTERLAKADPDDKGRQRDLGVVHNKIGDTLVSQGKLGQALGSYRRAFDIVDRLAKADPRNSFLQWGLFASYQKIGDALFLQNKLPEAYQSFQKSFTTIDRLAEADPNNESWQHDLGISIDRIGNVQKAQGHLDAALKSFQAARDISARLAASDPGNGQRVANFAASYGKLGQVLLAMGRKDEALIMFRKGRDIVAPIAEKSGNDTWIGYLKGFESYIASLQ